MPTVRVNGIDLYYGEHCSGEPPALIMGLGGDAEAWLPSLHAERRRRRASPS